MAVAILERTTFRTSRLLEFCSRKELVAQTGHEPDAWPLAVLKVHRSDPAPNLRENGATAEEIAFLRSRRVELNAFASADFVAWTERKLEQHGVAKILPDESALSMAWRRSVAARYVASRLQGAVQGARRHAAEAPVPDDLATLVAAGLRDDPTQSWDEVVQRLAAPRVGPEKG